MGVSVLVLHLELFAFTVIGRMVYKSECVFVFMCLYWLVVSVPGKPQRMSVKNVSLFLYALKKLYISPSLKDLMGPNFKHFLGLLSF